MAKNSQQRRNDKAVKRRTASKLKQKKERRWINEAGAFNNRLTNEQADRIKHKNIYDIINDREELLRLSKGNKPADAKMIETDQLFNGVDNMIDLTVKMHSGVIVYLKLVDEKRFELTEENKALIETYERKVCEFTEDVSAMIILDKAGSEPLDYVDLVIHVADLMHDMMGELRDDIIGLIDSQKDAIEVYATEHKPAQLNMFVYMNELHDARMKTILPLYATGKVKETMDSINELDSLLDEDPAENHPDDFENLPPIDPSDDSIVSVQMPQDPITEAKA